MIRNIIARPHALPRFARRAFRSAGHVFCAAAVCGVLPASAAIMTFDGHGQPNGNWSTPNNWVGNVTPISGSADLEIRLNSTVPSTITSNQDLGSPFELQRLQFGASVHFYDTHTINGSPLAFSNLGAPPTISAGDGFVSPDLVLNVDLILNTDVTLSIEGGGDAASHWYFNGVVSGPGGLKTSPPGFGGGILHLGGANANTYAGATTINYGWAYLTTPASVVAVPGDLFINRNSSRARDRSGRVYVQADNQIATTSTVTINGGTLFVQGGNQALANVKFTGLNSPFLEQDGGNVVISPGRTLTVTGGITRTSILDTLTASESLISGGFLDLGGGDLPIQVDNVMPEWAASKLTISSVIVNGDIQKTGPGILHLSGANNSFAGNAFVNAGLFSTGQNFQMIFDLTNGGISNRILGTANATLDGIFKIKHTAISDLTGVWNLVDVANLNETFASGLKLQLSNGAQFTKFGDTYRMGRWSFSTVTGDLTLSATPEPATLGMGAMAALLVGAVGRRMGAKRSDAAI